MIRYLVHPAIDAGVCVVVPIERVDVERGGSDGARWFSARRQIHAFVISDANGLRGLGPGGEVLSLEDLGRQIPGLVSRLPAPEFTSPWT